MTCREWGRLADWPRGAKLSRRMLARRRFDSGVTTFVRVVSCRAAVLRELTGGKKITAGRRGIFKKSIAALGRVARTEFAPLRLVRKFRVCDVELATRFREPRSLVIECVELNYRHFAGEIKRLFKVFHSDEKFIAKAR